MASNDENGEKTEEATPRQRQRARDEGRVATSREVGTLFVLTTATLTIYWLGPYMTSRTEDLFVYILQNLSTIDLSVSGTVVLMQNAFWRVLGIIGPLMLALVVASIAGYVVQFGFLMTAKSLQPKASRISPIEGAKRIFSSRMIAETLKSIFKFIVVGVVSYYTFKPILPGAAGLMDSDPTILISSIIQLGLYLSIFILLFLLAVALADYVYQKWQHEKSIRMSKYEVKKELKESEGDPQIRARVRAIRHQQARQQMMQDVERAEVVVTNPTHYAIAIRYDATERDAPHLVGKGMGLIAQRIKEIAEENRIPLYEDKWLARQLFRTCNIGDTVPVDLWQATAKVLAYVRALDKKRAKIPA